MGLLDRLLNRPAPALSPPDTPETWTRSDEWLTSWPAPRNVIAGEDHRQRELRQLAGCRGRCFKLIDVRLSPEPDNAYDSNAVAAHVDGVMVGYLRAPIAAELAEACAEAGLHAPTWVLPGVMRGGWEPSANIGVHVWLERRLTMGPKLSYADSEWSVGWPPHDEELAVLPRR